MNSISYCHNYNNTGQRTIGRWYLGKTVGRGAFSWVKEGIDIQTGLKVALKCIPLSNNTLNMEDSKENDSKSIDNNDSINSIAQHQNEINALMMIEHKYVMKLWGYFYNCKYPHKDGTIENIMLFIFEYLPNGSLLDYIYYGNTMCELLGRSYFFQLIYGLHACHKNGIIHCDIKLENLLLDSKFKLKICDFGLAKIQSKDCRNDKINDKINDSNMSNMSNMSLMSLISNESSIDSVDSIEIIDNNRADGTPGYQAPETLLYNIYNKKSDIFSLGVVLFIMLIGRPPFYNATINDPLYKYIINNNFKTFWETHLKFCKNKIKISNNAMDLINKLLCFDPNKRLTINDIINHKWMLYQPYLKSKLLNESMSMISKSVKYLKKCSFV